MKQKHKYTHNNTHIIQKDKLKHAYNQIIHIIKTERLMKRFILLFQHWDVHANSRFFNVTLSQILDSSIAKCHRQSTDNDRLLITVTLNVPAVYNATGENREIR